MQPRRQPSSAPGPRGSRPVAPLLVSLLLLALQGAGAAPAGPREPWDPLDLWEPWRLEEFRWLREPKIPQWITWRAAQAAMNFFNFRVGSPSTLRELSTVPLASVWVTPEKEYHIELEFTTKQLHPEEGEGKPGECSARVIFKKDKPRPAVNVTCTPFMEKSTRLQKDYLLYRRMKQLKTSLDVVRIPDNYGNIDPSLRPMWDLALLGSSYMLWEKTTPHLHYHVSQLSGVKQWKTDDDAIDFDYTVLIHQFATQEIIPCRIHLVWYPGKPLKVKYQCQELQTPDEAPATEEGSAVAPTEPSNF